MSRPAIFLDRDGVLVEEIYYLHTGEKEAPLYPSDVRLLPGVGLALRRLSEAGFALVLISNQGAVAKGKTDLRSLWRVHERFVALLAAEGAELDAEYYSFGHPDGVVPAFSGSSLDRKPSAYNILIAAARLDLELGRSWMVGDRETDVVCGRNAGTQTIRIADAEAFRDASVQPDHYAQSLGSAADLILREPTPCAIAGTEFRKAHRHSPRQPEVSDMRGLQDLKIKLFMDGAEIESMRSAVLQMPFIKGFTTNPTLMRKSGVTDYAAFAKEALAAVGGLPISFEVFSDEFDEMEREARIINGWGGATSVKIPVTNTRAESAAELIKRLSSEGIPLNVTAILTLDQVRTVAGALHPDTPSIISVFAGRIADAGVDPVPLMREAARMLQDRPKAELLWASPREVLNVVQAEECGCHIITATKDILAKLPLLGKDLTSYSLETVKMFYQDAKAASYQLKSPVHA